MAKKFGKFILFTAAVSAAAAGAYYYLQKKSRLASEFDFDDDDYDDFSEDLGETDAPRSYVPLNKDTEVSSENIKDSDFSSLAEDVSKKVEEKVEEFFDEDEK